MNVRQSLMAWNLLLGAGLAALAGIWIYEVVTPRPRLAVMGKTQAQQEKRLREQANRLYAEAKEAELTIAARLWKGDAERIGPAALAIVTNAAERNGVKLAAFRPQKPVAEGSLERHPYLISLDGTYPRVLRFVKELERLENRLVVNVVQIASSDGSSSNVTAVVGVWALKEAAPASKTAKGRSNV